MIARPWCTAIFIIWSCACGGAPLADLEVVNVSDEELHIDDVSAPEFAYAPIAGVLGRYHSRSMQVVKQPPLQVTVTERGKPSIAVPVPPLPADATGEIVLLLTYARSRRWTSQWEIIPARDANRVSVGTRRIPDDDDPQFRLHRALLEAAEAGNVADVDRLLGQGAPLSWDTTADSPLVAAAALHRNDVIERLLRDHESTFEMVDIEAAVDRAADPNDDDISTLRLLVGRLGKRLNPAARARVLKGSADSHSMNASGIVPAGPAIRYLIEEAGFDVNLPVNLDGDTVLDIARGATEPWRDEPLIQFLEAHGAVSGRRLPQ